MIDLSAPINPATPDDTLREQSHRVSMGVEYLDTRCPEWWRSIDLDTLELDNGSTCVLAQLYGDWVAGVEALGLDNPTAETLGFVTLRPEWPDIMDTLATRQLTPLWRAIIRERQADAREAARAAQRIGDTYLITSAAAAA